MKLAIFAHYDKNNQVQEYVKYYLQQLKMICDSIVCVTTSVLSVDEIDKLKLYCSDIIPRDNVGHDFYSYKVGLDSIKNLAEIESLILCNDSCYGPLFDLCSIFQQMHLRQADFWGISALSRPQLHLQSYFLVFNQRVINSFSFKQFWQDVTILDDKDNIIRNYEVGLSQQLIKADFSWDSVVPHQGYLLPWYKVLVRKVHIYWEERKFKSSRYSWKTIGEPLARVDKTLSLYDYSIKNYQLPLVKKSLFSDHWHTKAQIIANVERSSNYPCNLFENK